MTGYMAEIRKYVGHRTVIQCAASIICIDSDGRLLLGQRSDNKLWGYSGGSVEIDEKIEDCAKRELLEEMGLIAEEIEFFYVNSGPETHYIYPNGDEVSNVEIIYLCRKYSGIPQCKDGELLQIRYFRPEEISLDMISPPIRPVMKKYLEQTEQQLPALPDYDNCLVNLANSVLKKFGTQTSAGTLQLADKYLEGEYKNVVILLLDALGVSILEKHLKKEGFFRSHFAGSFNSVYPPTTVAATTSIMSGLYPNEHGWLGWDMYYPELDKNVTVFRNTESLTEKEGAVCTKDASGKMIWREDSLNDEKQAADFNAGFTYTPYKNVIDRINEAGGNAYFSMPFMPPYPKDIDEILQRIKDLCNEPGKKFIYAYWNEPDSTMHKTGTTSPETHKVVTDLENTVEKAVSRLTDTLFIITADHGHMDSKNLCILDYPEILECLERLPSLEPRTLNLFVKEECRDRFPELFKKYFGDAFILLTREEAIDKKLFGTGKDRNGLEGMIGDYVAVAISDTSIFKTHYEAQEMPGGHAGLTPEEYIIPLIVVKK